MSKREEKVQELKDYLKKHNITKVVVTYSGSGDDGWEEVKEVKGLDGKDMATGRDMDYEICYIVQYLYPGGYYNCDGGEGHVVATQDSVELKHYWYETSCILDEEESFEL